MAAKSSSVTTSAGYLLTTSFTASLSSGEFVEILPDQTVVTMVLCWRCWLHDQLSSNDTNCHNFKHIKFYQDCFLKFFISLLSKFHFLTVHCVRRGLVKVKVAFKGPVKTLIPSSEIFCKSIFKSLYIQTH